MGAGSGRHGLSDAEKKAKGTYREDKSEAARSERAAAKIVTGVFLAKVPEPSLALDEIGKAKYVEVATLLFNNNKLTIVTCMDCELVALHWQSVQARIAAGKPPSTDSLKQIASITARLKIAEDAPTIANPNQKKRFEGAGFSNIRSSPYRLRRPGAAGTGEL